MKICLRRAARISTERLISVQTDEQTEIDMETNMAENMGDKSVYIRAFWPREINQSSQRSIKSNSLCYFGCFFDLLIDLVNLSRGPKACICTISHMRTRMLYLT